MVCQFWQPLLLEILLALPGPRQGLVGLLVGRKGSAPFLVAAPPKRPSPPLRRAVKASNCSCSRAAVSVSLASSASLILALDDSPLLVFLQGDDVTARIPPEVRQGTVPGGGGYNSRAWKRRFGPPASNRAKWRRTLSDRSENLPRSPFSSYLMCQTLRPTGRGWWPFAGHPCCSQVAHKTLTAPLPFRWGLLTAVSCGLWRAEPL